MTTRLSDQQIAIMKPLWEQGELTTSEVHAAVAGELDLAYTTVATVLRRLEKKGAIRSRRQDRQLVYTAVLSRDRIRRSMVSDLVGQLFAGDPSALMAHLVMERDVDEATLEEIRNLLEDE